MVPGISVTALSPTELDLVSPPTRLTFLLKYIPVESVPVIVIGLFKSISDFTYSFPNTIPVLSFPLIFNTLLFNILKPSPVFSESTFAKTLFVPPNVIVPWLSKYIVLLVVPPADIAAHKKLSLPLSFIVPLFTKPIFFPADELWYWEVYITKWSPEIFIVEPFPITHVDWPLSLCPSVWNNHLL